jgi:EF-P lysine aminoacylase GenX
LKNWEKLKQNPNLFEKFFIKEYTLKAIRRFFEERNYHEFECPILADSLPQERYLDVFEIKLNTQLDSKTAYLIPTTETFNKRILAAGLGNHFVISKVFREMEQISPNHSPEFTMMEWYTLGGNYTKLMDETEELVNFILNFLIEKSPLFTTKQLNYQGRIINFESPWYRFSLKDVFEKYLKVTLDDLLDNKSLKEFAKEKGINFDEKDDWQAIFEMLFAIEIEDKLPTDKPYFLYDYPKVLCPLTREKKEDPRYCEKVELYIGKKEVANGYTELIDPVEQRKRFDIEREAREQMNKPLVNYDNEIIRAMESGIPDVAGIGMGIDRLVMILANAENISDINYFPASEMF